jgi:hypothetical protein
MLQGNHMSDEYLFNLPEGEMIWFNSEYEVKEFISYNSQWFNFVDAWDSYGFTLQSLVGIEDEDDEYQDELEICDYGEYPVYPVFDSTFDSMEYIESTKVYPEDIILNEEIYYDFPMVGFFYLEKTYDRMGDMTIDVFHIDPVSKISTVDTLKQKVQDNKQAWEEEFEHRCHLAELQEQRMKEEHNDY